MHHTNNNAPRYKVISVVTLFSAVPYFWFKDLYIKGNLCKNMKEKVPIKLNPIVIKYIYWPTHCLHNCRV